LDTPGETGQHQGQEFWKRELPLAGKGGGGEPNGIAEFGGVKGLDEGTQNAQEFKIPS
jgi:hypothetical protein